MGRYVTINASEGQRGLVSCDESGSESGEAFCRGWGSGEIHRVFEQASGAIRISDTRVCADGESLSFAD